MRRTKTKAKTQNETTIDGAVEPSGFFSPIESDPLRYYGHVTEPNEVARIVARWVRRGSRVLDVGCGTGLLAQCLADECAADVTGIEPSDERASVAESRGIRVVRTLFSSAAILPLGKFDVVVFADVLEHFVDPAAGLQLAKECLEREGTVMVSLPNVAHWTVRWELLWGRFEYQPCGIMDATHLRWFTRASACRFFERAGFLVEESTCTIVADLAVYDAYRPWKWLGIRRRARVLNRLVRYFPALFACQYVFRLRLKSVGDRQDSHMHSWEMLSGK